MTQEQIDELINVVTKQVQFAIEQTNTTKDNEIAKKIKDKVTVAINGIDFSQPVSVNEAIQVAFDGLELITDVTPNTWDDRAVDMAEGAFRMFGGGGSGILKGWIEKIREKRANKPSRRKRRQ